MTDRNEALPDGFDPEALENLLNAHAARGWRLAEGYIALSPWKAVLILERNVPALDLVAPHDHTEAAGRRP